MILMNIKNFLNPRRISNSIPELIQRMPLYRTRHHLRRAREIDRSRGDFGMPHHARERVEVAAAFEHEGGERMSEAVRGKLDSRTVFQFTHEPVHARYRHGRISLSGYEEMVAILPKAFPVVHVLVQDGGKAGGNRHDPVFLPLPLDHVDRHAAEIHVLDLEVRDLRLSETRKKHEGDHGHVALGFEFESEPHPAHGGEEAFRVIGGKRLRQRLTEFREVDTDRGVFRDLPFLQEVTEQEPDVAVASAVRGSAPVALGAPVEEPPFYRIAGAVAEPRYPAVFEIHAAG